MNWAQFRFVGDLTSRRPSMGCMCVLLIVTCDEDGTIRYKLFVQLYRLYLILSSSPGLMKYNVINFNELIT